MLAQSEMIVVIMLAEKITPGTQECVTAEGNLKETMVNFLKVPQ